MPRWSAVLGAGCASPASVAWPNRALCPVPSPSGQSLPGEPGIAFDRDQDVPAMLLAALLAVAAVCDQRAGGMIDQRRSFPVLVQGAIRFPP